MHLTISNGGHRYEAVLLAISQNYMRLARKGYEDIFELRVVDGVWVGEDGVPVGFDSIVMGNQRSAELFAELFPLNITIGARA